MGRYHLGGKKWWLRSYQCSHSTNFMLVPIQRSMTRRDKFYPVLRSRLDIYCWLIISLFILEMDKVAVALLFEIVIRILRRYDDITMLYVRGAHNFSACELRTKWTSQTLCLLINLWRIGMDMSARRGRSCVIRSTQSACDIDWFIAMEVLSTAVTGYCTRWHFLWDRDVRLCSYPTAWP